MLSVASVAMAQTTVPTTTTVRVKQSGKLRLGYRADARPFSFKDESGKPAGFSVALCENVAGSVKTELGLAALSVEWVPVTLEDRFRAVQEGRVDLLCGADTKTLTRMKDVAFSTSIFPGGIGAMVRSDASAKLLDALNGQKPVAQPNWRGSAIQVLQTQIFSAIKGTTTESWMTAKMKEFQLSSKVAEPVDGYATGVQRVLDRKSNVFFGDRAILLDAMARNAAPYKLKVLDRQFTYEPVALVFARGDADFRLVVDRALSKIYSSNEIQAIYKTWFGVPDPSALGFFRWNTIPD